MTSPQTSTATVAAAVAATGNDGSPTPNIDLTAVENHAEGEDETRQMGQMTIRDTDPPAGNSESERVQVNAEHDEGEVGHALPRETADANVVTSIDATTEVEPANTMEAAQPELPPLTMAELEQMNLAWAGPDSAFSYNLNGMGLPQDPAQGLLALQMAMGGAMPQPYLDPSPYMHEMDETRVQAYAKLEFADGEFYMNTYSVILGRDVRATKAILRRGRGEERRRRAGGSAAPEPRTPKTPVRAANGQESRYTKSIVSESGGILREGDDSDDDERQRRRSRKASRASRKSKSTGSSQQLSRRGSLAQPNGVIAQQTEAPARRTAPDMAVPVDPESLRPSPHDCPLVAIHPGATTPISGYKSISRKHVKIAYNSKKYLFEAKIVGRNGAFIDEEFYHYNDTIPLNSGSRLQIGGVVVRFILPDVAVGETGAERRAEYEEDSMIADRYSEGGKEMSFDFEDTPRVGAMEDTSEEPSPENESGEEEAPEREEVEEDLEDEEEDEQSDQSIRPEADERQHDTAAANQIDLPSMPPKKRGPGRPPKNGIMSKREQQLIKKEALARERDKDGEKAFKTLPVQGPVPGKNKVGRPRKHPRPDTPPEPREKRKYTKRKPKEPKDGEVKQEGSGEDQPAKEKKDKKPPKPPRSPSPQFNEAELSPEQLAKPQSNYVTLIHEALSNSPTGQMSLPQIYRAIQRKYPYFVLKCSTNGWQSSVRHNLSQHHAFRKVERDGKGWMWAIVEGVSIEKEKKKRASPPPQSHPGLMPQQPMYQTGHPHMMPGYPYGPGMMGPPPGYPMNAHMPPNFRPGQPPQYMGPPHPINGQAVPPVPHPSNNPQAPPPFAASIAPQLTGSTGPTYSSPYAPKPAASNPPQNELPPPPQQPQQPQQPPPQLQQQLQQQQQQQQHQQQQQQQQHQQLQQQQQPPQPPPPTPTPQQQTSSMQPAPTAPPPPGSTRELIERSENIKEAIEKFKTTLIKSLKETGSSNSEAIVNSAVNRVLGYSNESAVPGEPKEDLIMNALRSMLQNIPALNFRSDTPSAAEKTPDHTHTNDQSSPQPLANQNGTQNNVGQQPFKTTGPEKRGPIITRPSFSQARPNGPFVPRPPMTTPGMKRANSGSPANAAARTRAPSSASPAPPPTPNSTNGASTPQPPASEKGQLPPNEMRHTPTNETQQLAGQKRERTPDDAEDMPEFKKIATSGLPQLKT
ncbi:uncharacterized protein BP5553_05529 [Venustampulla echinocandica]|uniref:Fork-head domain-containing protein n=1 Tax=Venustampulla echinocandica TaxID=2656787 RepID=A0A370TRD5_9HELO|nr:uncharacterized protein BP5553_05529 [Venustampulla echinocandica]RDL38096.1 hypothetical protein BP5553_05529 [Venustampulla echinocandica]